MALTIGPGITVGAGVSITPSVSLVTDGLVLHYDFSNPASYPGTGTSITDLSTAANNGTVVNDYGAISYVANAQTSFFNWSTNVGGGGSGSNAFNGSIHTATTNLYQDFTMVFEPDFSVAGIAGLFGVPGDKSMRFYNNAWQAPNPGNGDDWASAPTTFYINGTASNQAVAGWNVMGGATTNPAYSVPQQLYIGTSCYENRNMQGNIAVVLMYDRTLTSQEQLQNYNYFKLRFGL